jgi:flagellar motor protein MotB
MKSHEAFPNKEETYGSSYQSSSDTQPSEQSLKDANHKGQNKITDKKQQKPPTIESKDSTGEPRVLAIYGDGMFRAGQFIVSDELESAIAKVIPVIETSPHSRIIVEGHTDNIKPSQSTDKRYMDNMELSFLRAKAVAFIFVKHGIPLERISVVGYGDTRPVADNNTNEGRAKNRRVEVKLVSGRKDL